MTPKTAFYFRKPDAKTWRLIGVYPSAEEAWVAALELKGSGDLWFPTLLPNEPINTELTAAEAKNFKVRRLTPA